MDTEATTKPISIRLVIGSFLVVLGALLTIDSLGLFYVDPILRWWSLVLVVIGGLLAMRGRWVAGVIWAVIGAWILGWNLGLIRWSIGELWPFLLIGLGVVFVRQGLFPRDETSESSDSRVDMIGCFFANARSSSSRDFRGGSMTAMLGGASLDLTNADIQEDHAVIDVFACCGGIVIRVPSTWAVVGRVTPVMGGFEDKSRPVQDCQKRLVVRGFVLMGGVEIKN